MSKNDDLVRRLRALAEAAQKSMDTGGREEVHPFEVQEVCEASLDAIERGAAQGVAGVAPLEWSISWGPDEDGDESHVAGTPFGSYTVERLDGRWRWKYCFDEYYDEDEEDCDDLEDGKSRASAHWLERVSPVLATPPAPAPDAGEEWALVPREMTADMINAWSGGLTITADTIARRTPFQEAWSRVIAAAASPTPQPPAVEAEAVKQVAWRVRPMPGYAWVYTEGDPDRNPDLRDYEKQRVFASPPDHEAALKTKTDENEQLRRERDEARADANDHLIEIDFWKQSRQRLKQKRDAAEASNKALREVVKAVAHIGVDFGYGPYALEEKHIANARALLSETGGE